VTGRSGGHEKPAATTGAGPRLGQLGLAVALGAAGGYLFVLIDLPLPWMLGAMSATTVAAIAGLRLRVPAGLRQVMVAVLGIMLGSAFTPEIIGHLHVWVVSLACLLPYAAVAGALNMFYLRRVGGYPLATAYFAGMPGGFNEMVLVGGAYGGDERAIALNHAARILLVVFILPFWFRYFGAYDAAARAAADTGLTDLLPVDVLVLAGCGVVGTILARALRAPAHHLLGPMVLSAAVHVAGLTASRPPTELIAIAQVVVGASVGCRFAGIAVIQVARALVLAIGGTAILLAVTAVFAAGLHAATGLSAAGLILAFSPGGLAEMSLVALALGLEAAFVSTHHLTRLLIVIMLAPLVFRLGLAWPAGRGDGR
jgi:membrane AbrB-like protein